MFGDKLLSLLRGMNLSMSVASPAHVYSNIGSYHCRRARSLACITATLNIILSFVLQLFAFSQMEIVYLFWPQKERKNERTKSGVLNLCVVISFALLLLFLIGAHTAFSVVCIFQFTLFIFPNGISCHIFHVCISHIVYRIYSSIYFLASTSET